MNAFLFRRIYRILYTLVFVAMIFWPERSSAACEKRSNHNVVLRYAPLIITAPTSLVFTGIGYTLDGVYMIGTPLTVGSLVCLPLSMGSYGGDFFGECLGEFFRNTGSDASLFGNPHLGSSAYSGTSAWRCPF